MRMRLFMAAGLISALVPLRPTVAALTNTIPAAWTVDAPRTVDPTAQFDAAPSGISTSFVVHSTWRGQLTGTLQSESNAISFAPAADCLPGETLEAVIATPGLTQPFGWRFSAAPSAGSGTFITNASSRIAVPNVTFQRHVAVADLNGDRALDIVVPDWNGSNVVILANSGTGTFTPTTTAAGTSLLIDVTPADINSDGAPDLVFGCFGETAVSALNDGSAGFDGWATAYSGGGGDSVRRVVDGDLDGDGWVDVLAVEESTGRAVPLLNTAGVLAAGTVFSFGHSVYALDVGDVNADGALDVVVAGADGYVAIATNNGNGVFNLLSSDVLTAGSWHACRLADFDRDGHVDVAVAGTAGYIAIGFGTGSGWSFTQLVHTVTTETIYGLATGDVDGNGLPDLLTSGGTRVGALLNRGDRVLTANSDALTVPGEYLRDIELADLNGDGSLDIVVCGFYSRTLYACWNAPESRPVVRGINGAVVSSDELPSLAKGTDFGDVPINQTATNTFQLVNEGSGALSITAAGISGASNGVFQVVDMPTAIASGATSSFSVVFSPPAAGTTFTGVLAITNNSPITLNVSPYLVRLSGVGAKAQVTSLSLANTNHVYDGTAKAVTANVTPLVDLAVTYDGALAAPTNAGHYVVVASVTDPDYSGVITGALHIATRPLVGTTDNREREYGEPNPPFTFILTGFAPDEGTNDLDTVPGVVCAATTNSPAGSYPITLSGGADVNYAFNYSNATLTVTQALLSVSADEKWRAYGDINPPLTISMAGWKNHDTTADLTVQPTATTTAEQFSAVGDYPITVAGGVATNYAFAYSNSVLHVLAAPASITLTNLLQTYDGTPRPVFLTTNPTGLLHVIQYNGLTNVPVNAASYGVLATIVHPGFTGSATGTLVIARAGQAIDFPAVPTQWATNTLGLNASASSGLPVQFAVQSGPATLNDSSNVTFSASGTVFVVASQGGNTNWTAALAVTQSFSVVRAPATLSLLQTNQTYDGTARAVVAETSPTGLAVQVTYEGLFSPPTNAGSYLVQASVTDPLYTGSATGLLAIARRALNVRPDDAVREYGAPNPASWPLTYTGFAAGDDTNELSTLPAVDCGADLASPAGAYPIVASNAASANYAIGYSNGTLTVTQAVLTVTADNQSRAYGETNPVFTITYAGWKNTDDVTDLDVVPLAACTATVDTAVGIYPILVGGGTDTNYAFAHNAGTLTVYQATAQVTITDTNQVFDGSARVVTVTTDPSGLSVIVTYDGITAPPTNAGTYAISVVVDEINYMGAGTSTLVVARGTQEVTGFSPPSGFYPSEQLVTLSAQGTLSGIAVLFNRLSGPGLLVSTNALRFTDFGPVAVTASQAGNENWNASPVVTNIYEAVDTNTVHYVAQAGQDPLWPYADWSTAASNLQEAVNVAADGDRVVAGDGMYNHGASTAPGSTLSNRLVVTKAVTVESLHGPATTTISGHPASGTAAPLGPDAVRCVYLANGAVLGGFTLQDGGTRGTADGGPLQDQSGGGVWQDPDCTVSNCVVTGNAASYGGGIRGGTVTRCTVSGNTALFDGGGIHSAIIHNSVVWSNTARFGSGVFRGTLRQCTVAGNTAAYGAVYESTLHNCIVYHNAGGDVFGGDAEYTCAANGIAPNAAGNTTSAPLFVDLSAGDLYLLHDSPCINAGLNAFAPTNSAGASPDVAGRERILHAIVDMGAYEYDATPEFIYVTAPGAITAHGFDARWAAPTGTVTIRQYTLIVSNLLSGAKSTHNVGGAQTSYTVAGLDPGTTYAYRLLPRNEYAVGVWSDWTNLVTLTEGAIDLPAWLTFDAVFGGTNPAAQPFSLGNSGETLYAWSSTLTYGSTSGWLSLSESNGVVEALSSSNMSAAVDIAGLDAGIHTATNTVTSPTATNSPQQQRVVLTLRRGIDSISLNATNQVYNGTPRAVTALSANGQSVALTYDGAITPPVNAGVYAVTGIVDSVNWTATNTTVLTVSPADQAITAFLPLSGGYDSTNVLALAALGGGSGYPVVFSVTSGPGLLTGGNLLRFTDYGTATVTASQAGDSNWNEAPVVSNAYTVVPVSNLVHYVALAGQTPIWPYASPDKAASNIQAAVDSAWAGDQVLVAPGRYEQGGRAAPGFELMNRVLATKPIRITSEDGPDLTFIAGAPGPGGVPGNGAVRCASLSGGAILEGFTLTDGFTLGALNLFMDRSAAGALLADTAELRYCVLRNGTAEDYGGGAYLFEGGSLVNCVAYSNAATVGAGVYLFRGGSVFSSTLAANAATIQGGGASLFEGGLVVNTIAYFNTAGTSGADFHKHISGTIRYSCARDGVTSGVDGNSTNAPSFVDAGANDYRLLAGSAGVDAGRNADARDIVDMEGDPRIIGTIDMGADELMTVPGAPIALPATGITALAFTANWQAGDSMPVDGFMLHVVRTNDNVTIFSNTVGTATQHVLTALSPSTPYRYRIQARNVYGSGAWSAPMGVSTLPNHFVPVFQQLSNITVKLGTLATLQVTATDDDGTTPSVSLTTGPSGGVFNDLGGGQGTFMWTPTLTSELGDHTVEFSATDGWFTNSVSTTIHVLLHLPPSPAEKATYHVITHLLLLPVVEASTNGTSNVSGGTP